MVTMQSSVAMEQPPFNPIIFKFGDFPASHFSPQKKPTAPPDSWHLPKVTPVPELTAALPDRYGRYGLAPEMLVFTSRYQQVAGENPYKIGSLTVANGEMIMWQSMPETLGFDLELGPHWDFTGTGTSRMTNQIELYDHRRKQFYLYHWCGKCLVRNIENENMISACLWLDCTG